MRILYVLLTFLVAPLVMLVEAWKALVNPDYRGRLHQRLGLVRRSGPSRPLWIHAVSVGEVQAAAALVRKLQARYPQLPIVISTVTPTGAARVRALFQETVTHAYLPYDLPGSVARFLDRIQPRVTIIVETEIWPTLYHALGRRGIPLVMASARVSARSVDRYRRMASLFRQTMAHGVFIGAQTPADAERFVAIGAAPERVHVTGNIKFDMEIPAASIAKGQTFRRVHAADRPVWIAGSTHEGEEDPVLAAHDEVLGQFARALLIIAPRHPQRFEAVRALLRSRGVRFAQHSKGEIPGAEDSVLLLDTLGELQIFYAAADVAFVAGSLVPVGGHSLLEPALLGLPILSGPHTQNAQDIADLLAQSGALRIVRGRDELAQRVREDFADAAAASALGARGRATVAHSRGAVDRIMALVAPLIDATLP
jgi:3-deoxy-D-manno-octulosonic-acid transferase